MPNMQILIYLIVVMVVGSRLLNIWSVARSLRGTDEDSAQNSGAKIGSFFGMPIRLTGAPSRKFSAKVKPRTLHLAALVGITWYAIESWLKYKTGWPSHYGLQCFGKCRLSDTLPHSFALLHHGRYELALFMSIWAPWVAVLLLLLWVLRKRLVGEDSFDSGDTDNSIAPDNSDTE